MVLDRIFVAAFVIFILLVGGLFHAAVPHSHGSHSHSATDGSVIWKELHSSLRHEDKKAAYMLVETAVLTVATLIPNVAEHVSYAQTSDDAALQEPGAPPELRRGIEKYRTFG